MDNETVVAIKNMVRSYLPDSRILLFGSHATGLAKSNSDYDLMVITSGVLTQKEKVDKGSSLRKAIIKAIHAPVDLLLYTEDEVTAMRELPGHIVRSAMNEGRML